MVFGASGDLTARKLMPALQQLALRRLLPAGLSVVGVARTEWSNDQFLEHIRNAAAETQDEKQVWDHLAGGFRYVAGNYDNTDTYKRLAKRPGRVRYSRAAAEENRVHYLAVPPTAFPSGGSGAWPRAGLNRPARAASSCAS